MLEHAGALTRKQTYNFPSVIVDTGGTDEWSIWSGMALQPICWHKCNQSFNLITFVLTMIYKAQLALGKMAGLTLCWRELSAIWKRTTPKLTSWSQSLRLLLHVTTPHDTIVYKTPHMYLVHLSAMDHHIPYVEYSHHIIYICSGSTVHYVCIYTDTYYLPKYI